MGTIAIDSFELADDQSSGCANPVQRLRLSNACSASSGYLGTVAKREQPQKFPPAFGPRMAVLRTMPDPQRGHVMFEARCEEGASDGGGAACYCWHGRLGATSGSGCPMNARLHSPAPTHGASRFSIGSSISHEDFNLHRQPS